MKTNVITIEKDVPIPEIRYNNGKVKYKFLDNMEVGDSTKPGAQLGVDYFVFPMYTTAVESTAYEEDK